MTKRLAQRAPAKAPPPATRPTPEEEAAAEAARIRAIAQDLLDRHEGEGVGYEKAAFLATLIEDDADVRVAIKAHRLLVDYLAELATRAGLADPEPADLMMKIHDFISSGFLRTGSNRLYAHGRWVDLSELHAAAREEAGAHA